MAETLQNEYAVLIWRQAEVLQASRRASSRALVGRAERVVSEAKQRVHRLTGTLSRSTHSAPVGYADASDFTRARGAASIQPGRNPAYPGRQVFTNGQDLQQAMPANVGMITWAGDVGEIWAGSFIRYADIEEGRHPWLHPAFEAAERDNGELLRQAFREEGF